jgi:FkbM family methyltransferase
MDLVSPKVRKALYRAVRYHWSTEWLQNGIRRSTTLHLPEVKMELEVQPGQIIIDCGASVGDFTSRFARTGAKVYAFEPNPTVFQILENRFKILSLVECLNQGVMDKETSLTLRVPLAHGEWDALESTVASSFVAEGSSEAEMQEVEVRCIDLAVFIRSLASRVRLLKIDIEGAEITVLNSLIDTAVIHEIDQVVVETHEEMIPHLLKDTEALRARIQDEGLEHKIDLNWV